MYSVYFLLSYYIFNHRYSCFVNQMLVFKTQPLCVSVVILYTNPSMKKNLVILRKKLSQMTQTNLFVFLAAASLGALMFVCMFGLAILNPSNTDWLMYDGDLKQHFVGWEFFRESAWTFPIGMIEGLAYPYGLAVTFMDSIPLVAIPLKLLQGVLPEHFQYFGLWGLLCYMLQGGFAALILRHWTKNTVVAILGSVLFVASPIMFSRMFAHTALASHWLLLAGILAVIKLRHLASTRLYLGVWTGLMVLAVLIHPYFLPMMLFLLLISITLTHQKFARSLVKLMVPMTVSLLVFYVIGGLSIRETGSDGLGEHALNLTSLFNPLGWSRFLNSFPIASSWESLAYVGFGVILLMPLAVYFVALNIKKIPAFNVGSVNIKYVIISLIFAGMVVAAVSPKIQLGSHILVDINIPHLIEKIWSTFRATGRLFWPIYYIVIVAVLVSVIRLSRKSHPAILVSIFAAAALIQIADIQFSKVAQARHGEFSRYEHVQYDSRLNLELWKKTIANDKHIVSLEPMSMKDFFSVIDVALAEDLTINTGYFARGPYKKIADHQSREREALLNRRADVSSNFYITRDYEYVRRIVADRYYNVMKIDGYYVIDRTTE